MKLAILGFGEEGKSLLAFLWKKGVSQKDITILDKRRSKHYLKKLEKFTVIYRSPGIPYMLPELIRARKNGVIFSSATKLFFAHCPAPIIGITGTKGKGTTATLLYNILRAHRKNVFLAGNIGKPMLSILPKLRPHSLVILELSSFQLQDLTQSPHIAVVLDVFPDHLDAHKTLAEYYRAKTNIARHQTQHDIIFFAKHNAESMRIAETSPGKKRAVDYKRFGLFSERNLAIPGEHNVKNAAMAAAVARSLGVPTKTIARVMQNFRGMEHRLELVRKVMVRRAHHKNKSAIYFYNDSASTNPHTAAAAVLAFKNEPHILIAGGQDKNLDYAPLRDALKKSETKLVVLFGENKTKIARALRRIENTGLKIEAVSDLRKAISVAYKFAAHSSLLTPSAKGGSASGGHSSILFSPGSASFDQFKNYRARGKKFKEIVKRLKAR